MSAIVRPSGSSGHPFLLYLPPELHLYIGEFLHAEYLAHGREHTPHPLLALRLVHSRFRDTGTWLLFMSVTPLTASNFRARQTTASTVGSLVQKIKIDITGLDPSLDSPFSAIVQTLRRVDELTLIYDKDDEQARPELVTSLCGLRSMTSLKVEEAGLDITQVPADDGEADRSCRFIDYMLNNLLSNDNMGIRSFAHIASTSLHPSVFHNLRTRPTRLRTVELRGSIQYGLRGEFNEPDRWFTAATLERLVIRACSGTHYISIARHVVSGVFGNLKHLAVIGSGYIDNDLPGLRRPVLSIRALVLLEIDHAFDWEVLALATIPAKEVHITRVVRRAIVAALTQGGWAGLEILKVQRWGEEADTLFPEFRLACAGRDLRLQVGAIPYGRCTCHDDWVAGTETNINIGL